MPRTQTKIDVARHPTSGRVDTKIIMTIGDQLNGPLYIMLLIALLREEVILMPKFGGVQRSLLEHAIATTTFRVAEQR